MPDPIIARWLNLPAIEVAEVKTAEGLTELALRRSSNGRICSGCRQPALSGYDARLQHLRDLAVFEYATYLLVEKQRVQCPRCGIRVEWLSWCAPYDRCTQRFAEYVARLCRRLPVAQVAELLGLDWKTVKEIDKQALQAQFAQPDYRGVRLLAIDEVSYKKRHKYLTVVLDLERTRVVWVGVGRSQETLDGFFRELGPERAKQPVAVACDMWDPYLASLKAHAPQAAVVFDKFHVIAAYGRLIDEVRNDEYRAAAAQDKAVIKGTKYLLLKNAERLTRDEQEHLERLLALNRRLEIVYVLKDELKRLWDYEHRGYAERFLTRWCQVARRSGVPQLAGFAAMLERYEEGLLNHTRYPINTAALEGTNNKIKVLKRRCYGFHDLEYFILKIKQGCQGSPLTH